MITVKLHGFEELTRILDTIEPKAAKKIMRQSTRDGVKKIQQHTKHNCPVRTGNLKKGYKVRATKKKKRGEIGYSVVNLVRYSFAVETGTSDTPALPHLRPAWDGNIHSVLDEIKKSLDRRIRDYFRRGR